MSNSKRECRDCGNFGCRGLCCGSCGGIMRTDQELTTLYKRPDVIFSLPKCTCRDEHSKHSEQDNYYSESEDSKLCYKHESWIDEDGCYYCRKEKKMTEAIICLGDFMVILESFKESRPRYKRPSSCRSRGCSNCQNLVEMYSGAQTEVEKEQLETFQTNYRLSDHSSNRCPFQCETGELLPEGISVQMRDLMNFHPDVLPQLKQLAEMIRFDVPRTFEELDMLIFGMSRHFFNQSIFLFHAVREEKIELARYLIWNGISGIEHAMYEKDIDAVKLLFKLGDREIASFFDIGSYGKQNYLMTAIEDLDIELIQFLLELPTISENINKANDDGKTALFYALESANSINYRTDEYLIVADWLIKKGANVNHLDNTGKTCLDYSIENNNSIEHNNSLDIKRYLLANGATIPNNQVAINVPIHVPVYINFQAPNAAHEPAPAPAPAPVPIPDLDFLRWPACMGIISLQELFIYHHLDCSSIIELWEFLYGM